jgi:hypothetical protein
MKAAPANVIGSTLKRTVRFILLPWTLVIFARSPRRKILRRSWCYASQIGQLCDFSRLQAAGKARGIVGDQEAHWDTYISTA